MSDLIFLVQGFQSGVGRDEHWTFGIDLGHCRLLGMGDMIYRRWMALAQTTRWLAPRPAQGWPCSLGQTDGSYQAQGQPYLERIGLLIVVSFFSFLFLIVS